MKYLLMLHTPGRGPYPPMVTWPKKDMDAHLEFLRQFNRKLSTAGELVGIEALTAPDEAKLIRRQGWHTHYRRRLPRGQGVSGRLPDRRRRQS